MKETSTPYKTTIECAFPFKALAAAGTKDARRAIVIKAAEREVEPKLEPQTPRASETNKKNFHALSPQERRRVFETQSNNISRFLESIDFKGIELQ